MSTIQERDSHRAGSQEHAQRVRQLAKENIGLEEALRHAKSDALSAQKVAQDLRTELGRHVARAQSSNNDVALLKSSVDKLVEEKRRLRERLRGVSV